ncbi:hypothetical protein [Streptomyces anulatus]|uniref:hypothetical protein n=1 Tax=Streptomyces anulatus TaxID=1892 RepID=UPI002E15295D|nr:hypothetical protein OG274_38190 [Streptomyces anulatus]
MGDEFTTAEERFATPDQVLSHWRLDAGDSYRVSETKSEAEERRHSARSRGERASDAELIGGHLLIARVRQSLVTDEHLWGVFHAGTSLPVIMLKSGEGATAARALAEALDTWRDPETGEAFDWASDGLRDRLRSPYGRGLFGHARGRDPGELWAGTAPADAEVHETDDGQEYRYAQDGSSLSVYAPGGLLIARAVSRFDTRTRKDAWIGETRDGRRLSGRWVSHFVINTVQQHLIAQREPSDRDDLWIHYSGDRAMVHGVDRTDKDLKQLLRSSGFTSSGHAKAYVTAGTTRPVARAQGVDRLARALYEEGRAVEIRADEDRLRGVLAPAAPASPGAPAPKARPGLASAPAVPAEVQPVVSPQDLTEEQLASELKRLEAEAGAAVFGGVRRKRLDEQIAPLKQERKRRVIAAIHDRPDPAGMTEEDLTAERAELAEALRGYRSYPDVAEAREARVGLVDGELGRRVSARFEARLPVLQMTDEDLQAEGLQLSKDRSNYRDIPTGARPAVEARSTAVGVELADRYLRAWEAQQAAVGDLDDDQLTEALGALRRNRPGVGEFAGHHLSKRRVEDAQNKRRDALQEEQKARDAKAFEALLKADGRVEVKARSHYKPDPDKDAAIYIEGRRFGNLTESYPGWLAGVTLGRSGSDERTVWRTEALRWLIEKYEASPETRDTRTWGRIAEVELPPAFVLRAVETFTSLTGKAEQYLIARLDGAPRSQTFDEHGNKLMAHFLDLPERTLPVLEQLGRRLVDRLDEELDSPDTRTRNRAKAARPKVLRGLDDIRETMQARGLRPLTGASAGAQQEGETDGERVRDDGPAALGDVPAQGAGPDSGPGGVLPGAGAGRAAADRGADPAEDGRSDAGDGPSAAGGQAEGGPADVPGAGAQGDRVPGAGGGEPGRGAAPEVTGPPAGPPAGAPRAAPVVFRPASQDDLAPAGERPKAAANLEAVRVLKRVGEEKRAATAAEQQTLARWSGWGSVPEIFAARPREDDPVFGPGGERENGYANAAARWESFADVRDPLRVLLNDDEWDAAAASTLSAHYTPPEITSALWQALADLGFDGGEVLEPGSGAGVTFGTAPDTARLTGVEIDPTSAAISRLLAPGVTVLNESFADTVAPDGSFDAVVGNVPFARVVLYDPKHNRGRHRIHNHFLVKSGALVRPGGVVALITSRHTLDALLAAARQELFQDADLLGAVRLPNKAFARSAGTDVVTDILILRRRIDGERPLNGDWVASTKREIDGHSLPVNDYFAAHPEHVLGTLTTRMGAHGPEVAVDGDPDVAAGLRTALRQITDSAVLARRWYTPHPEGPHRPRLRLKPAADLQDFSGRLSADADGKLWQTTGDGEQAAVDLPEGQQAQLAALVELKDLVRGLNELDRTGADPALAVAHRRLTKQTYERYVAAHGPLSRPKQQRNATTQTADGENVTGLTAWGYFLNDPQAYEVLALEMWEADTQTVHVSEVLDRAPAARRSVLGQHTDDPQQALNAVVAERGHVDLPHIAWMLQTDEPEARRRLGRSVFTDPLTGDLLYSADYLSGDVRTKLEIARQAARRDETFKVNIAELERVQPREMLPGQFAVRLGAAWLPDDLVQQFFREYLGDAHLTVQHSGNGNWHILKGRDLSEQDEVKHTAGGLHPLALLNRVLNGGSMTGRPSDDEEAARAVRVKADEWRDAFEAWALDDAARAARIADVYNRQMNNRVVRDFTGTRPSLAGLDPDFTPYDHQLSAAARMAHERCLVLSHVVGAGKTGALAIGMMAMKNTGQIDKPLVAVPNYLVEQWESEVRRLFPAARILTLTSDDLADGKRDRMLQYVRANSFDMIIMSHSLFDSIPLSPEFYAFYRDDELRKMDAQIIHERRREGKSISLKQLEERRQNHEQELKRRADAHRTPGQVYIDDLGLDFIAVDEAHEYKNLAVRSKIPGARVSGSAKAQHLHAVMEWARRNKPTGPMGCLATGTPLSNAIGELHSLLLLAHPDLLRDLGIEEFDAFATMYGKLVERLEMTVDGKGFKSVERFASYHNVNSLLRQLWLPLVDYKDEEDLGLPLPGIRGGEPELMLVPATTGQRQLMQELGDRYEACHRGEVDKSKDNALSINTDARVIALDPRLIDSEAEPGNKLRLLADRIAAEYHETKNNPYTYSTEDLRPHPVPGGLQMVFLNQGTPGGKNRGNFNAYQELKNLLIARDVPADKIDFIHDANRPDQRRKLVARANHGGSNVLIGSTQRMGKGLNAQNRCTTVYHVDPDFRPADMKQKDGRGRRKGNQNKFVGIVWVATNGTFDSRMYGTLATKAKGFDQIYKAKLDAGTDEIEELDEALVPYEEAQAIISGNPYLIAQEDMRKKLRTLTLDQNNRSTQRAIVFRKVQQLTQEIDTLAHDITRRGIVLPTLRPVLGDDFQITLGGTTYTKHKDAAVPLTDGLAGVLRALPEKRAPNPDTTLGHLGGRDLVAVAFRDDHDAPFVRVHLDGLPGSLHRFSTEELGDLKGETLLRRLTKTITEAPERQVQDEGNLTAKRATRDELLVYSEQLRGQLPGLSRARERLGLVDALVAAQVAVNKAGDPAKDEPSAVTENRQQAVERRDNLQQQLDRFDATPPAEASPEAGEALLDMDEFGRRDPAHLSPQQKESEAAILRAHASVHGDPDGAVAARLAALGEPAQPLGVSPAPGAPAPAGPETLPGEAADTAPLPDTRAPSTPPEPTPADPPPALKPLLDALGDRVILGHIGGPQTSPGPPVPAEAPADEPEPSVAPESPGRTDDETKGTAEPDGDGYGTFDFFEESGLAPPERVPRPAVQEESEPEAEAEGGSVVLSEGQMLLEEDGNGRERLPSADGRLAYTLFVPPGAGVRADLVAGWQRTRNEFLARIDAYEKQSGQSAQEKAEHLARWRRTFKGVNGLEPFRPLPALRLTRRTDASGLTPAPYGLGSWLTWRDKQSGEQVIGQVMAPGSANNTWFVSTDRSGHTGEYHVLYRTGKKATGYTYSLNGAVADLRPAGGPGDQRPLQELPQVDSVPYRPVSSYADWLPAGSGLARVREPITVTVGPMGPRFDPVTEVAFDVVADGIPFIVTLDQDDASLTPLYRLRVEDDGVTVAKLPWAEETPGAAVAAAVRVARRSRELGDKPLYGRHRNNTLDVAEDGVCAKCFRSDGERGGDVVELYRVNGGDPMCAPHIANAHDVSASEVEELGLARRIIAVRTAPEPAPAQPESGAAPAPTPGTSAPVIPNPEKTEQEAVVQETAAAAASQDPHEVAREALQGGNRITMVVSGMSIEGYGDIWGDRVPETATVTGTVYPGYRDYRQNSTLLDAVIVDPAGGEVIAPDSVFIRYLPAQVQLIPAEHRDDLRPETRTVAHVRLGDLIAEGGTRGESVTELRFSSGSRGSVMGFSTRDVAKGTPNGFALAFTDEVLVVSRERREPQDVAEVFGRHSGNHQVTLEARQTFDLHAAVTEVTSGAWPDGTGPQDEIRALSEAIGAIDAAAKGVDAYRANAAAMEAADAAAAALFAATDDAMLNGYVGLPLHRLRQHLDVQAQRLHADVAHLIERAANAPAESTSTDESASPVPEEQGAPDQPTERAGGGEDVASRGPGETEQLGLFGDPAPDPAQGPAEPGTATGNGTVPADEPSAQAVVAEDGPGVQLQAALIEGETIAPVSYTDRREPAAGWILTTAGGHTFRLRPETNSLRDEGQWEAGHDAGGSHWWAMNLEDRPLNAVLARVREDSATRARFASLWARYGHLTEETPQFGTTTDRVQLEEGVYLVSRFGSIGLIASCRWGWEHLTDPGGAEGHTGEGWSRKGPDNRQYVAEWQVWNRAQDAIANARLRVVARLTDDMADTPDAYCDASAPYVGKCSAKRSGGRYTVAVDTDQGSEIGCYTVCARCLSHRLLADEDRQIDHRDVRSLVQTLAKGDPKVGALHWKQWPDRTAELAGQMLSAALDAGETAPWPARALAGQLLTEACEVGDDRAMREARAEAKAAGGNAGARKRAADEAFAARQDRAALIARAGGAATAILELAGWGAEGSNATPEPAEETVPEAIDVDTLTVSPQVRDGKPSTYEFDVTGPGLTVGTYEISHDAQGKGARGIIWRAWWHGVEPSGRWDVISIGSGEGESAALAAVAEHAAQTAGDLAAGFTAARRMHYDAGLWLLPDVGESESIEYGPDGSWTITAETGAPYTVRSEWQGRTASGGLAPLLIEDQTGSLVASCTAVDSYMYAWAPMLDRLRLHATAVADGVQHATAVTVGGPTQDWVEAWCVCSWTERADVAKYADRAPAGEALALVHHQEASAADGAPAAAELPELDVVLLDVDVPPLDPAEPYEADEEAQADIDRLGEAFARWEALPTVQRYYEADRQQRPDGTGDPANPVAQLAAAYRDAEQSLRDGPVSSPDELVRQVQTVAVWSGALEPVVDEDLHGPLGEVREAAALLASRSRATVEAFEAELAALSMSPAPESPAAEAAPAPAPPSPGTEEPAPVSQPVDEPSTPAAAQPDALVPERETGREPGQEDAVEGEPGPVPNVPAADLPEAVDEGAALDVEDPPAPRSYTEVFPLREDAAYRLHLTGLDGQAPSGGELRFGETMVAAVSLSASGRWFARLTADGLPADLTMLNDSPQDAAHQGAVMFAALTGTPYGAPPGPAVGDGAMTRVEVLRGELRAAAQGHHRTITVAAARVNPDATQIPQFQVLGARLDDLAAAESGAHDSRQMAANLEAVQQAADAWGGALPADPALDERQHLMYPLAHLLHDTTRLHARLQATLDAAQAERTAAAAAVPAQPVREEPVQQAPPSAAPERVRGPVVVLGLREDGEGQLAAVVATVDISRDLDLPGVTSTDVPGMPLPVRVEVPMLVRPAQRAEQLVSDEETHAWLAEHLADGPLAQAWSVDQVRAALVAGARDVLREGMAPSVEEVADWLVTTAAEQDGLLQAAHAADSVEDFAPAFTRAADDLVADGGAEFLVWRYLGDSEGNGRLDVLALATPGAYEQLRALPAPADERGPQRAATGEAGPTAPITETPEDPEMATPARDDVPPQVQRPAGEVPQPEGPVASIQLRKGTGETLVARVTTPDFTRTRIIRPGPLRRDGLPELALPVTAEVPMPSRTDPRAESLVQGPATEQWLSDHLEGGPMEPALRVREVETGLGDLLRDVLLESLAPSAGEIATWLAGAIAEDADLLHAAHKASLEDFTRQDGFARVADDLVASSESAVLRWAYSRRNEGGRNEVLALAAPDAYERLRAQELPRSRSDQPAPVAEGAEESGRRGSGDGGPSAEPTAPHDRPAGNGDGSRDGGRVLDADSRYRLRLTGVAGEGPREGQLLYGEAAVAAVQQLPDGNWFARLSVDGSPADVTSLTGSPQDAAHQGAVMFAVTTGEPFGDRPVAADAQGELSRADVLRRELYGAADQHLRIITVAAARANPNYAQNPQLQALSDRLGTLRAADADSHGSWQMAANLEAVQQAAIAWGGTLPADPVVEERRLLAFPLMNLLRDTTRLHGRLQATLDAESADRAAAREQEAAAPAAAEPARDDTAQQNPAPEPAPTVEPPTPADTPSPERAVDVPPADQSAPLPDVPEDLEMATPAGSATPGTERSGRDVPGAEGAAVAGSGDLLPDESGQQESGDDGRSAELPTPREHPAGNWEGDEWAFSSLSAERPERDVPGAAAVASEDSPAEAPAPQESGSPESGDGGQSAEPTAPQDRPAGNRAGSRGDDEWDSWWMNSGDAERPGDLPLHAGDATGDLSAALAWSDADLPSEFGAVVAAWDERVPADKGTGEELAASVEGDLAKLQQALFDAAADMESGFEELAAPEVEPAVPAVEPAPVAEGAPASGGQGETGAERDPQEDVDAVNAALREADVHAADLQALPEWQRIQTVRGAFGNLMKVMKERAGEHFGKLMEDGRVSGFVRRVSLRACEKVAGWAQAGADWLRQAEKRSTEQRAEVLPSAEALLRLGDAAIDYRGPRVGGATVLKPLPMNPAPDVNSIPEMQRMGKALSRPLPGRNRVSAAAARGRSTTGTQSVKGAKKSGTGSEQAGHLRRGEQQAGFRPNPSR